MSVFAALAAILAALGIYGVLAYLVDQRRRELGIRIALGAARGDVLALVVRQGSIPVAIGLAAGIAGALALTGRAEKPPVRSQRDGPVDFRGDHTGLDCGVAGCDG
jgi:ABC-type lipoprotein release transport system permease subunit